jgi:hypothetical protein
MFFQFLNTPIFLNRFSLGMSRVGRFARLATLFLNSILLQAVSSHPAAHGRPLGLELHSSNGFVSSLELTRYVPACASRSE